MAETERDDDDEVERGELAHAALTEQAHHEQHAGVHNRRAEENLGQKGPGSVAQTGCDPSRTRRTRRSAWRHGCATVVGREPHRPRPRERASAHQACGARRGGRGAPPGAPVSRRVERLDHADPGAHRHACRPVSAPRSGSRSTEPTWSRWSRLPRQIEAVIRAVPGTS